MTQTPEIAVVIVNYGTADLAIAAAESVLARSHGGRCVEVHLVDNASPGDDAARISRAIEDNGWQDRLFFYAESENHGFGRGNNVALRALQSRAEPPEKVFFLNPDARLVNGAIDVLAGVLDTHPEVGIAGSGLIREGTGTQVSGAFRYPGIFSEFESTANVGLITSLLRRWVVSKGPEHPAGPTDWVSGAAFMGRFDVLAEAEFFDPAFFLYYEEMDLMRRVSDAGWVVWYEPAAQVAHVTGAATDINAARGGARPMPSYWYDSWRIYFTRHHGRFGALVCAAARLAGFSVNLLLKRVVNPGRLVTQNFYKDFLTLVVRPISLGRRNV